VKGTERAALGGSAPQFLARTTESSTASLVVGVAAAGAVREDILLAGIAGMVAGALSMAAGEYVSVSSQADTEGADLALERSELAADQPAEERELAAIYVQRGAVWSPAWHGPLRSS
jgi:VIT1/CCC1 family predicted Fe2+/Mn2+ transporter